MARVQLPQSKLRARKRRQRVIATLLWLSLGLLLAGTAVGLVYLPHWRVAKVEVVGVEGEQAQAVTRVVQQRLATRVGYIFPADNIVLYPRTRIVHDLLTVYPLFARVDVGASSLRSLRVEVALRTPKAVWCGVAETAPAPCFLLDEGGVAYEAAAQFGGGAYTTYYGPLAAGALPRQYLSAEEFHSLTALVAALENQQNIQVRSVEVDDNGDAHAHFATGFELIFSPKDGGGDVYERFVLALSAEPFAGRALTDFEYLDLRFGDKLYYKLKGE